jgi:hypothetical protein
MWGCRSMVWKNGYLFWPTFYEEAQYIIETKDNTPEEISISGNSYVVSDEIVDAT